MFQKFTAPLVIVSAASAVFFACSSDSSSSSPVTPQNVTLSGVEGSSDNETSVSSSSDKIATNSSSSLRLSSANLSSSSIDVSVSAETSSSDKGTDKVGEPAEPAEVYLWHDEFDSIDTTTWTFETGASGWGNNEWQYYTARSENAFAQDGILHIRANKEDYEGAKYTSARMITKGKFSFTYGTVEARIALPVGKGIWPAFWMLGENIDAVSWPACGEIDIIEAVNSENVVYGTNHWQAGGNQADYGNNTRDYYGTSKELDITQFHNYKMVWNEKLIAMYVDDFKYQEIAIENAKDGLEAFHKPQFFILNVAVAGNWPGFEVDDSQFPNEMLVDYIRVSQP